MNEKYPLVKEQQVLDIITKYNMTEEEKEILLYLYSHYREYREAYE
ncbi:MAG: hypothetical protein QW474_02230 [Candidatus Aenigmatarchaeota archaeon]